LKFGYKAFGGLELIISPRADLTQLDGTSGKEKARYLDARNDDKLNQKPMVDLSNYQKRLRIDFERELVTDPTSGKDTIVFSLNPARYKIVRVRGEPMVHDTLDDFLNPVREVQRMVEQNATFPPAVKASGLAALLNTSPPGATRSRQSCASQREPRTNSLTTPRYS
jgi:hypothetical protein